MKLEVIKPQLHYLLFKHKFINGGFFVLKLFKFLLIFIFFIANKAQADTIAVNNLLVEVTPTVSVDISGNFTTNIDPDSGNLGSNLSINFLVASNESINNIQLKALVNDSNNVAYSAFASNHSGISSHSEYYIVLANNTYPPSASAINDCKLSNSNSLNNEEAIAYMGSLNIDNSGTVEYQTDGNNQAFYNCSVNEGNTNISLNISPTPKPGTYDSQTALDGNNTFEVLVYLDNIP